MSRLKGKIFNENLEKTEKDNNLLVIKFILVTGVFSLIQILLIYIEETYGEPVNDVFTYLLLGFGIFFILEYFFFRFSKLDLSKP